MTLTIIIVLLLTFGVVFACAVTFIWRSTTINCRARHAQWLWNSGFQESSRIVNPYLISWIGF